MRSSNANGRQPAQSQGSAVAASWRHPNRHMNPLSCYTGRRIFSGLSIRGSFIRRWIDTACPRHRVDAIGSRGRRGGVVCGQQPENLGRLDLPLCSRGDHDHERIRGAVSAPSAVTASNLRGGPETQSGRKAEPTPLGDGRLIRCDDDNIEGRVASLLSS